ncbi:uncharacterized protein LOC123467553 [Daphnia magna]|uniref:uncharacterized protein LOC123467553 n=1 Tax=Daphnia magna TaxID=35525 RepID=UPI001E1BD862|nr:uncharacterized protein LOC123467553 [Daphnia magna]
MASHEFSKDSKSIFVFTFSLVLLHWLVCAGGIMSETEPSSSYVEEEHHSEDHELEHVKHRLEILPEAPLTGFALVKRVDETLNLTCQVVKESGPFVKFQLEWHLPQHSANRMHNIFNKPGAINTLHLTITKLQESDSGMYRCIARGEKLTQLQHSVDISILPRKGTCGDNMFMCSSKSCIPQRYKCDGTPDCGDGADESKEICGESPCDGKLHCDDGRCISKKVCCDKYYDANCTATYEIPCCGKLLNFLAPDFPLQTSHQFHEIGFLQSTMYTIIGCAVAFVLIVTFTVITVCRVHMRRSALPNAYAAYRSDTRVWSDLDSYLATSNNRWTRGLLRSDLSRSPGLVLNSYGDAGGPGPNTSLLVTYNINNGVQLMGRPVEPPPYEEVAAGRHATGNRDEPPPPYVSRENLSTDDWSATRNVNSNNTSNNVSNGPFLSAIFSLLVNNAQPLPVQPQLAERIVPHAPAPLELAAERVEEDNNNGDINGNNTGQIWVRPNFNNRALQNPEANTTEQPQRPSWMNPSSDPRGSPPS